MFRSSENLRLAADMRALERVARPWREVRASWFDGTPESIEARLASTERVLTFAKAGVTEAHVALEREAAAARAELKEASHRLMVDPLDDSARAFKGSKRVAGKHDADPDAPWKNQATGEDTTTEHWDKHLPPWDEDYEGKHREGSRRVAGADEDYAREEREFWRKHVDATGPGIGDEDEYGQPPADDYSRYSRLAKERGLRECINCGGSLSGEEDDDKESECLACGESAHRPSGRRESHRVAGSRYFNDEGEPLQSGSSARYEDYLDGDHEDYGDHYGDDGFGPEPYYDEDDEDNDGVDGHDDFVGNEDAHLDSSYEDRGLGHFGPENI